MADKRDIKDDLNLMQTAYGVALVLALKNIAECFYSLVVVATWDRYTSVIRLLFSVVLMLTVVRFFWAVGNIRRFIQRNTARLRTTRRYVVSLHFLLLLIHAFSLFCLSKYTLDLTPATSPAEAVRFLAFGYVAFLVLNCGWLTALTRGQSDDGPEKTWIKNNAVTGAVATATYVVASIWSSYLAFLVVVPIFLANSIVDLVRTASIYVPVEEES